MLEAARRYEGAAEFWPSYLRGQAYLRQKAGREAATEFRKIIDNRGQAPLSTLYPLAQLGLARASALAGDTAGARTAYQNFLALWKDADADIAVRQEAQQEYRETRVAVHTNETSPSGERFAHRHSEAALCSDPKRPTWLAPMV